MAKKVRVITRNGSTHDLVLPAGIDPVDLAHVLTGGKAVGKAHQSAPEWIDTESGRIRVDVIAEIIIEDDEAATGESNQRSKKDSNQHFKSTTAGVLVATGLLTAVGGAPVDAAQAVINGKLQNDGPTIVVVSPKGPHQPKHDPGVAKEGDLGLVTYLWQALKAGGDRRKTAIGILKGLAPLFGSSAERVSANPEAALTALRGTTKASTTSSEVLHLTFGDDTTLTVTKH